MISSEVVTLKGGLCVSVPALQLLWAFEDRGIVLHVDDAGYLLVGPRDRLTLQDRAAIKEHRNDLVALVRYELPQVA